MLVVKNVARDIVSALRKQAAEHGRSIAAEHREILRRALMERRTAGSLKDLLRSMPSVGSDADFERLR